MSKHKHPPPKSASLSSGLPSPTQDNTLSHEKPETPPKESKKSAVSSLRSTRLIIVLTILLTILIPRVYNAATSLIRPFPHATYRTHTYISHYHCEGPCPPDTHNFESQSQSFQSPLEAGPGLNTDEGIPLRGAIKSAGPVSRVGPLHINGKVSSSGPITLSRHISVNGKIQSSAVVTLSDHIRIGGKVESKGGVKLSKSVEVTCDGNLVMSGSVEVQSYGDVRGNVVVGDGVEVVFRGKLKVRGSLNVNGHLHVKGNLDVSGSVNMGPFGDSIVDGHRTIWGGVNGGTLKI